MTDPQIQFCQKAYRNQINEEFNFLKSSQNYQEALLKAIQLPNQSGILIPIGVVHLEDQKLIESLTRWRTENSDAYPTQFQVTEEGTKIWLKKGLLDIPDRILFLVCDPFGHPIGHLGYAHCINQESAMEIDNVLRGEKTGHKGIMTQALDSLLKWAQDQFAPETIFLRVFSDNTHAVQFYEKIHFVKSSLIPLKKTVTKDRVSFDETNETADRHFQKMVYTKNAPFIPTQPILTAGPLISAKEPVYSYYAAQEGWNTKHSEYLQQFEKTFSDYIGSPFSMATSSCTGALHIALKALNIGSGDEVIVPDLTWVATANAVLYVGATPVFADIEKDSWCIDPQSIKEKITSRTKAIIPVHLYGHPARMDDIMKIARDHNLFVIEDAAPAIGAEFNQKKVGTFGHFSAFSFQGAKLAVTGEGGILLTSDDKLFKKAHKIWDQGRKPGTFFIEELGLKYKMSNIQAAIGLAQIEKVDQLIALKRKIFYEYEKNLNNTPHIELNYEVNLAKSIYWMTSILLKESAPLSRDKLIKILKENNIDSRPVFPSISTYPYWPHRPQPQPVAYSIGNRGINLPSGVLLKKEQIQYICKIINNTLGV